RRHARRGRHRLVGPGARHGRPRIARPGDPGRDRHDDLGDVPMRVTASYIARVRDEESGAVLVFVAVCLVVLLGMAALTVDLGRAVAIKRDMVNAADAAALAGADVCARTRDAAAAEAAAADLSSVNGADGAFSFSAPNCAPGAGAGTKTVTVTSRTFVNYLIAPILGFDGTNVVASATAIYV